MEGIVTVGSIASAPARCLNGYTFIAAGVPTSEWPEIRTRVMEVLRALVETGSTPLDSEEYNVAEIISLANAGCVDTRAAAASGVLPGAWLARAPRGKEPEFFLVPSSNITRLYLASDDFPPPPRV